MCLCGELMASRVILLLCTRKVSYKLSVLSKEIRIIVIFISLTISSYVFGVVLL